MICYTVDPSSVYHYPTFDPLLIISSLVRHRMFPYLIQHLFPIIDALPPTHLLSTCDVPPLAIGFCSTSDSYPFALSVLSFAAAISAFLGFALLLKILENVWYFKCF